MRSVFDRDGGRGEWSRSFFLGEIMKEVWAWFLHSLCLWQVPGCEVKRRLVKKEREEKDHEGDSL